MGARRAQSAYCWAVNIVNICSHWNIGVARKPGNAAGKILYTPVVSPVPLPISDGRACRNISPCTGVQWGSRAKRSSGESGSNSSSRKRALTSSLSVGGTVALLYDVPSCEVTWTIVPCFVLYRWQQQQQ